MCKSFFKMEMDEDSEVAKYNEVFDYLASKSYPEGYDKGKKLVIRRRSKDYQICKGKLCYIGHMKRKKSLDPNIKVGLGGFFFKVDLAYRLIGVVPNFYNTFTSRFA